MLKRVKIGEYVLIKAEDKVMLKYADETVVDLTKLGVISIGLTPDTEGWKVTLLNKIALLKYRNAMTSNLELVGLSFSTHAEAINAVHHLSNFLFLFLKDIDADEH